MSLYQMMYGVNSPVVFFVLPCLGKHPDEYPRFRDAFVGDAERPETEGKLIVRTRTGGESNRDYFREQNQTIRNMPSFVFDYDDDFDRTYANWVFDIPEQWRADVKKLLNGKASEVSQEYREKCASVFPKIADKILANFEAN